MFSISLSTDIRRMVGMEKEMRPVGGRASEKVDKNMNFATCRLSKNYLLMLLT